MPKHELYSLLLKLWWLLFVVANGACIGSLINVLVYRLPRGISVIWPPSACPNCHTKLTWRENFPIFGWLALRGRCRTCRTPISPEYPLVEAATALTFGIVFAIIAWMPFHVEWLGVNWGDIRPEWAWNPIERVWPTIVLVLMLIGCLIAMTIVDLKTYTIPAPLTTFPAVLALLIHPVHAAWFASNYGSRPASWSLGARWSIPIAPHWGWLLATIGACVGLALATGLVRLGMLKQSFADYDAWEKSQLEKFTRDEAPVPSGDVPPMPDTIQPSDPLVAGSPPHVLPPKPSPLFIEGLVPSHQPPVEENLSPPASVALPTSQAPPPAPESADVLVGEQLAPLTGHQIARVFWTLGITVALAAVAALITPQTGLPGAVGLVVGILLGPIVAGFLLSRRRTTPPATTVPAAPEPLPTGPDAPHTPEAEVSTPVRAPENPAEVWIAYPHARREMIRELAFLAPAVGLAYVGWHLPSWMALNGPMPLWLGALGGVLMGYLIGGGVVWAVRILGSLVAGKEAMGLGDVHMMAAVGACLGWIDATLAFFGAAFVGLYFVVLRLVWAGSTGRAMPYGPYLAAATLLVYLGKPWVDQGLSELFQRTINLP